MKRIFLFSVLLGLAAFVRAQENSMVTGTL
jgi:hypothetical protein